MTQPELANVAWIGGAQWAGKTTVASLLAARFGLIHYVYDYHDARSHADRARSDPGNYPRFHAFLRALESDPNAAWLDPSAEEMAETANAIFAERFAMVVDDLRALPAGATIVAEGWGLRPDLIATVTGDRTRAVFLVPSEDFRRRQMEALPRAGMLQLPGLRDPAAAQEKRLARDRILAQNVVVQAKAFGFPVIVVDGERSAMEVATEVETYFRPHLPRWLS